MKIAVILIGLFLVCVTAEEEDKCPLMVALKQAFADCVDSLKPSDETLEAVTSGKDEDKQEVQCFHACTMKKAGLMENAKFDIDKMEELLKSADNADEEKISLIIGMMKECKEKAEVTDDECEVAGNYSKCVTAMKEAAEKKE